MTTPINHEFDGNDDNDEGEEEDWIPLGEEDDDADKVRLMINDNEANATTRTGVIDTTTQSHVHFEHDTIAIPVPSRIHFHNSQTTKSSNRNNNHNDAASEISTTHSRGHKTVNLIRARHERNVHLKQSFIDKPLLLFPKILLYHLMTEFWNSHCSIRIGTIFIITGICLQSSSVVILFLLSLYNIPQMIISTLIIGFISYFALFHLDNPIYDFFQQLSSYHHRQQKQQKQQQQQQLDCNHGHHLLLEIFFMLLEYINGTIMRRICICIFFILPILMETRALILLSSLVTEGITTKYDFENSLSYFIGWSVCWGLSLIQLLFIIPMHFQVQIQRKSKLNQPSFNDIKNMIPISDQWKKGVYPLPLLFGHMILKLKHNKSLFFDVRIHSWIYSYTIALLTTILTVSVNQIHKPIILAAPFLIALGSFLILSCHQRDNNGDEDSLFLNTLRRALRRSLFDVLQLVGEDVAEDDKLQLNMLTWIVDYWATNDQNDCHDGDSTNTSSHGSVYTATAASQRGIRPETSESRKHVARLQKHEQSSTSASTSNSSATNNSMTKSNKRIPFPSFINIDERARTAVLSYKKAVEDFPPTRNVSMVLGVTKRCPAVLSAIFLHLSGALNANYVTIILLPMIIFEWMRIYEWINACHYSVKFGNLVSQQSSSEFISRPMNHENESKFLFPSEMEPMEILLSLDSHSTYNRGSALQVWINIKKSVSRLEASLTAVKCAQTANIATDVVFDVMSLAKFGLEVKNKGLPHGISVLAKDLFQFQMEKSLNASSADSDHYSSIYSAQDQNDGSYSKAAMNLINNSQQLSKNVSELFEEGSQNHNVLHPIISAASFLVGKGWLWGKEQPTKQENIPNQVRNIKINSTTMKENEDESESVIVDMQYEGNCETEDDNICSNHEEDSKISMCNSTSKLIEVETHMNCPTSKDSIMDTKEGHELNSDTLEGADRSIQKLKTQEREEQAQQKENTESNNGLNLLGAGLAVVASAIVGGIAIAKKNEENIRRQQRSNNVTIELLNDDEE